MNIALKDMRFSALRFALTAVGIGLLLGATMGMIGLYRGIVHEALLIINDIGADLWVVEGGRSGPFAETSAVPASLDRRVEGVPGVSATRRFIQYNQQYQIGGKSVRLAVTGIDYPKDTGSWIPLIDGRLFRSTRYEAIADASTGLLVGDVIRLGHDDYTVVGVTRGQVDMGGDGMFFVTIPDAQAINRVLPSEAILLNRIAKGRSRMGLGDGGALAAVMVELKPNADPRVVKNHIKAWGDVEVLTQDEERAMLLDGRLWRLRVQILAFTAMTLLVAGSIIALTIYMLTLEKIHQIALLKLIGARDRVIIGLIVQQALWIGALGFSVALAISFTLYPNFPRTVLLLPEDLAGIGLALLAISLGASWFAIRRAMKVRAQEVLA
ncbi:ABC transporter permease [Xanthobacter dioxanivorans]|uniref:ABC transporter permease n=1 Tax=Xanthobacter dioxanivorans TaxID=2528964 RepID=A0A974SLC2_9HYPH|nr:ABC transporter permease [Xanthobacter dioxanivorans]QRG09159.1 ABC transporter permease [Xanthobacter dioxanivorans]